jgi:3-oxoacyl-[acyl-carrier protein] reductase
MTDRPVALVTGASRGIGAETAAEFARRGYRVAVVARDTAALEATAARIRAAGAEALVLAGDLGDVSFGQGAVRRTLDAWGRLDALVNNAAWREVVTMRKITLESWEKTLRVCLTTPAFMAQAAAAAMEPRRKGVIINISSIQSERVSGMAPAYIAAKGALDSLTFDLAATYGPSGIRVVCVNPGAIDTEMSTDYANDEARRTGQTLRQMSEDLVPLRRWGTADEIAKVIAWLAGDEASYITGTTIFADGGITTQLMPHTMKRMIHPQEYP